MNGDDNDAYNFIVTLQREQAILEFDLPTDSRIIATVMLTTGDEIKTTSAYVMEPDIIVFIGTRDGKAVRLVTRYPMIAHCVFQIEKGKRQAMGFFTEPPSASASASLSPSGSASPSV